jgi:hypothetical protein
MEMATWMDPYKFFVTLQGVMYFFTSIWGIFMLFTRIFGLGHFELEGDVARALVKRASYCETKTKNGHKGWCVGCWFIGHIGVYGDTITLVTLQCIYDKLLKSINDEFSASNSSVPSSIPTVTFYYYQPANATIGNSFTYLTVTRELLVPKPFQAQALQLMHEHYQRHKFVVAFICGSPDTGKSLLGQLVAQNYTKANLFEELDIFTPGESWTLNYRQCGPKQHEPIIIMIDEIDCHLVKMHNMNGYPIEKNGSSNINGSNNISTIDDTIIRSKPQSNVRTVVHDKPTWNRFLDQINRGLFPWVYLIFTSNQPLSFFEDLDPSYIRHKRVHLKLECFDQPAMTDITTTTTTTTTSSTIEKVKTI